MYASDRICTGSSPSLQKLLEPLAVQTSATVRRLTAYAFIMRRESLKWAWYLMRQRPRLMGQDIESSPLKEGSAEKAALLLDVPLVTTSTSYARPVTWLIETSTDPDVVVAAASLVPDTDALLFLDGVSGVHTQLRDTFMSCFDDHDRCIPGADDKAIVCGLALAHMYWRRFLWRFDNLLLLPGETHYGLSNWTYDNIQEWDSFTRRWRYLESKDPKFLLVSQTGIGAIDPRLRIDNDLDLSPYPDAFLASLVPSLSCTFHFVYDKERIMTLEGLAINILLRLFHHSSPDPSPQILANCTFLVLCMLGLRFTKTDTMNTNKR